MYSLLPESFAFGRDYLRDARMGEASPKEAGLAPLVLVFLCTRSSLKASLSVGAPNKKTPPSAGLLLVAERAGFEPAVPNISERQFSKLVVSATHPSLLRMRLSEAASNLRLRSFTRNPPFITEDIRSVRDKCSSTSASGSS